VLGVKSYVLLFIITFLLVTAVVALPFDFDSYNSLASLNYTDYIKDVKVIKLTLASAEIEATICNPTDNNYIISSKDEFDALFVEKRNKVTSYKFEIEEDVIGTKIVLQCNPYTLVNDTVVENCNPVELQNQVIGKRKIPWTAIGSTLLKKKCHKITQTVYYPFDLFGVQIDQYYSLFNYNFTEYIWINATIFNETFDDTAYINLTESDAVVSGGKVELNQTGEGGKGMNAYLLFDGTLPNGTEILPNGSSPVSQNGSEPDFKDYGYSGSLCEGCDGNGIGGYSQLNVYNGSWSMNLSQDLENAGHWWHVKKGLGNNTNVTCEMAAKFNLTSIQVGGNDIYLPFMNILGQYCFSVGMSSAGTFKFSQNLATINNTGIAFSLNTWYKLVISYNHPFVNYSFYNRTGELIKSYKSDELGNQNMCDGNIANVTLDVQIMQNEYVFLDDIFCYNETENDKPLGEYAFYKNSTLVSTQLNSSKSITKATLTLAEAATPSGTNISCKMRTANNAWEQIVNGTEKDLVDGLGLMYNCSLTTTDNTTTPEIKLLQIEVAAAKYPYDIEEDTGNDGSVDYSFVNELNEDNSPQLADLNITAIMNYLAICSFDIFGLCNLPLNFSVVGESQNIYVTLPEGANVTKAELNISGFGV